MKYYSPEGEERNKDGETIRSFYKDWKNIASDPYVKGCIRNYFEKPTSMTKGMEMHVTTLNAGLKSYDPHTHRAAEIVLMRGGNIEMHIGDKLYKGEAGSIFFLSSNILHDIIQYQVIFRGNIESLL